MDVFEERWSDELHKLGWGKPDDMVKQIHPKLELGPEVTIEIAPGNDCYCLLFEMGNGKTT